MIEAGTCGQTMPGSARLLHRARGMAGTKQHFGRNYEILSTNGHTRPGGPGVVEGSLSQCLCPK